MSGTRRRDDQLVFFILPRAVFRGMGIESGILRANDVPALQDAMVVVSESV